MMMHETLHLRDDIDRLYASRKEGGIGLTSIDTMTGKLHEKGQRKTNDSDQKQHKQLNDQKWEEKQLYECFK